LSSLLVEKAGPVARLKLNRPERRNAMDPGLLAELTSAYGRLGREGVRVAVLSGEGPDFCAGADIAWMKRAASLPRARAERDAARLIAMCRAVDEAPFLTVAKVHGNCFGGALGIVGASDVVLAADDARFCFSELKLGILPAVISTFVLPKIGPGWARRWFLTSEPFGPRDGIRMGLVHGTVPAAGLDAEADRVVRGALACGPSALREAKAYLRRLEPMPRARRLAHSAKVLAKVRSGAEAREGFAAFLEKRPPAWLER
jgi:methylglutaconyl-CoA hydratase